MSEFGGLSKHQLTPHTLKASRVFPVWKLDQTEQKLDQTEQKLDQTEQKLDQTEQKLDQTEQKLDQTEQKLDQTEQKLDQTEQTRLPQKSGVRHSVTVTPVVI